MPLFENLLDTIGNTPLVRLNKLSPEGGATIYAKLEFTNPGLSVKDRMVRYIIEKAEADGALKPGGTIIENTSGNTGAGLAMIAAVRGYELIVTIPDKMSDEKINALRAYGAEVIVCPTGVPAEDPRSYYETAKRLVAETPGAFFLNQYHNKANIDAHEATTAPEIDRDVDGNVQAIVGGLGTGGTMSGVGRYFKKKKHPAKIVGVDPVGSIYHSMFHHGKPSEPHVYKVEGIGEDMVCAALELEWIDDVIQVDDAQCFKNARELCRMEGILAGGSSGGTVYAARVVASQMKPGERVVAILPDGGVKYLSKVYNDDWMRAQSFID